MIKTYLKVAIRTLLKRRTSTLIHVLGLAVGLACCALVLLYFRSEWVFDKGFQRAAEIYRVTSTFKDGSHAPTVAFPFGSLLHQELPEVEAVTRMDAKRSPCIVKALDDTAAVPYMEQSGYWVDPNFFDIFSYHFLYGDRRTAFSAPNTIVLSDTVAQWLFHGVYPLGKRVRVGSIDYIVSGVFRQDIPNHMVAGFFASNNTEGIREEMARTLDWVADPNYYTYVRLKPGSSVPRVMDELHAYTRRHATADMQRRGEVMVNSLQALSAIHLHSSNYYDYLSGKQGNLDYLYLLLSIAGAILLLGCINYINLSTAAALDRAREVGVRRVLGAEKGAIRAQFLVETFFVSMMALVLAVGLTVLFLPAFNSFTGQQLVLFGSGSFVVILWLLPMALLTGLLAGIYPAVYLSGFRPVKVLKGKVSDPGALLNIRKVLVVGQLMIATGLIFSTIVIWRQLQYMMTAKTGVDEAQQLVIYLQTGQAASNASYYMQRLAASPDVQSVTGAEAALYSGDMQLYPADKGVNEKKDIFLNGVDERYLSSLGLRLVAGANFTPVAFANTDMRVDMEPTDIGRQVILNEEAVQALGYTLNNVVGQRLGHEHKGTMYYYTVVGVVKDYHYFSMHMPIGPMALMPVNPRRFGAMIVKARGTQMEGVMNLASREWRAINGDSPFIADFLTNTFRYDYINDRRQQQMMGAFTVIAILISCLGVLGLITYSVGQKAREIGIRKVIGASVGQIVFLFARQYLWLVLIANVIVAPMAGYWMRQWLLAFPYRIGMSWWMFGAAFGMGCVVMLGTLSWKTVRAALANPVTALRSE
jgi:putative ABC transport system permease protein